MQASILILHVLMTCTITTSLVAAYFCLKLFEGFMIFFGTVLGFESVVASHLHSVCDRIYNNVLNIDEGEPERFGEIYEYPEQSEIINFLMKQKSFKITEATNHFGISRNKIVKISKALQSLGIIYKDTKNNNTTVLNQDLSRNEIASKIKNNLKFQLA